MFDDQTPCSLTFVVSNKEIKSIAIELTDDIEIAQLNFGWYTIVYYINALYTKVHHLSTCHMGEHSNLCTIFKNNKSKAFKLQNEL